MAENTYGAIVIGAGPAGSAAARTSVAGGLKTLLIEKKKLPRSKVCCGILSKRAVNFVNKKFGVIPEKAYCAPSFLEGAALYYPSQPEPVVLHSKDPLPNIWRSHFDYFLAVGSGAEIKDGLMVENIETQAKGFTVICKQFQKDRPGTRVSFTSKYVVAADGSHSRSVRQVMPQAYQGLPDGVALQVQYHGEVDLPPYLFNVFYYPDMGFYSWTDMKDDLIFVGCAIIGKHQLNVYHANLVSFLEKKHGLNIKETILKEGIYELFMAPLNRFVLGKGNFLAAGEAAGFLQIAGEGISCALSSGDLAGEAILTAEKSSCDALSVYRRIVRPEAEQCLDTFNPLRMLKASPIPVDIKSVWRKYSLKEHYVMWKDVKVCMQKSGFFDTGIPRVCLKNMLYHLIHRHYPVVL